MTKYRRGEKIECKTTILDEDGNAQTPSTLALVIYDNVGTANTTKAIGDLTAESTGVYTYVFTIPDDAAYGDWSYAFTPSTATAKIEDYKYFTVDAFDSGLYCTTMDVYRKAGIDSTVIGEGDVADFIKESDGEIRAMYQRSFADATTETEWIDIENLDEDEEIDTIFLDLRPVQSITSLESYDTSGTLITTWESSDYWLDAKMGRIRLTSKKFAQQNHRVKCVYTYGYTTVPTNIAALSATISAMRTLIYQIGGTYDDVTSYSLPSGVTIGVGEPYMNMTRAIEKLKDEKDRLIKSIGQLRTSTLVI